MRSFFAFVVLLLVLAPVALAQNIVPDTLDWHGYFPLEVGNAWEQVNHIFGQNLMVREEIVSDTLVDGKQWFILQTISYDLDRGHIDPNVDRYSVRYDASSSVERFNESTGEWREFACGIGLDFGSWAFCGGLLGDNITGEYAKAGACLEIGQSCVPYAAAKHWLWSTYYYGIGRVIDDSAPGNLTYARVGGEEYGERVVFLGKEEMPERVDLKVSVYPNPARDRAWLTLPISVRHQDVTVYDLLGRTVQMGQVCDSSPCELELGVLSPGLYFVRVSTDSWKAGVVPVQVER